MQDGTEKETKREGTMKESKNATREPLNRLIKNERQEGRTKSGGTN